MVLHYRASGAPIGWSPQLSCHNIYKETQFELRKNVV
jgi:hypothetical protein